MQQYFTIELYDEYQLNNPTTEIINKEGYIFLAMDNERVIGTVALAKEPDHSYELTKMSVTKDSQGKGVSKLLMDGCMYCNREREEMESPDPLFQY